MDAELLPNIDQKLMPAKATGRSFRQAVMGVLNSVLRYACSVRLGVTLLLLLGLACLTGMLVMQQNVDGFENYYATLTPAKRAVYGGLGLFNIYHVWYFNVLLCLLSLNIILASIDRFPKTWKYVSKPQVTPPIHWLSAQTFSSKVDLAGSAEKVQDEVVPRMHATGWKRTITAEKNGVTYIFGESRVWNRFGAYPVHVALLTVFFGGFLTAQLGTTGELSLAPGENSDTIRTNVVELDRVSEITMKLPFAVTFTDIEQKLVRHDGPLAAANTLDWITRFTINDEGQLYEGMVQMNRPLDYRGYRFFQSSFTPVGRARSITLGVIPTGSTEAQNVALTRDGSATLEDGTRVTFEEFRGNFRIGPEDPNEDTSNYPKPVAILKVAPPVGGEQTAYAFGPDMANIPMAGKPVAGYTFRLLDFEKVADKHVLSVQRDPGANIVYLGFAGLFAALAGVFLFSHQRVWVAIIPHPDGSSELIASGNTNRNTASFEERFERFIADLGSIATRSENK